MHVGFFERFLHLAHSSADHWAWTGTSGVNEICDPDFAGEIGTTEWFAILVGESAISAEMQKRVREMIKTFLERAREKLEGEAPIEQEPALDSAV